MANPKLLITAGCSFSTVPNEHVTWPANLNRYINPKTNLYLGQGAAGNGIISRRVIYNVTEQLKKFKPEEILVGIMWSSYSRHEVYSPEPIPHDPQDCGPTHSNPTSVAKNKNFYLFNIHRTDELNINYYKNFYNDVHASLITMEHILRVQWFLKLHNIKYFMAEYSHDTLPTQDYPHITKIMADPDVKYLYDLIDRDHWLPITNMQEFSNNSGYPYNPGDIHPTTEHHKHLTDTVIIPYLKNKGYID